MTDSPALLTIRLLRSQRYQFGIARFLFGLYLSVLVNGVVFRHAHRLADGTIICHAHPFKAAPGTQFPSHAHSRDELIGLDGFANALYTDAAPEPWVPVLAVLIVLLTLGSIPLFAAPRLPHLAFRHRGPPLIWPDLLHSVPTAAAALSGGQ